MHGSRPSAELLAVATSVGSMARLVDALLARDVEVDVALDLEGARDAFFARGGHDLLVLASDVVPALAQRVTESLTSVDPELGVVVFGTQLLRGRVGRRVWRIADHHPSSRAGAGAVLKALRAR